MRTAKNMLLISLLIIIVWAISGLVLVWGDAGCFATFTPTCNELPAKALKNILTLNWGRGWIYDYQQLIAGVLTFVAGAFVFLSAVYQRQGARRELEKANRDKKRAALGGLAHRFAELSFEIERGDVHPATLERTAEAIYGILDFAPELAFWLRSNVSTYRRYGDRHLIIMCLIYMLDHAKMVTDTGNYRRTRASVAELQDALSAEEFSKAERWGFDDFFG